MARNKLNTPIHNEEEKYINGNPLREMINLL